VYVCGWFADPTVKDFMVPVEYEADGTLKSVTEMWRKRERDSDAPTAGAGTVASATTTGAAAVS